MSESNEKIARGLVKHLHWGRNAGLHFDDNTCVKPYHQLSPFNASVDQFPDAYVFDRGSELPPCTFEVHSGYQYNGSVTKTITGNYVHGRTGEGEAVKNKYFYLVHEIKIRFKQSNHQEPVFSVAKRSSSVKIS